jgi:hypothetical protein
MPRPNGKIDHGEIITARQHAQTAVATPGRPRGRPSYAARRRTVGSPDEGGLARVEHIFTGHPINVSRKPNFAHNRTRKAVHDFIGNIARRRGATRLEHCEKETPIKSHARWTPSSTERLSIYRRCNTCDGNAIDRGRGVRVERRRAAWLQAALAEVGPQTGRSALAARTRRVTPYRARALCSWRHAPASQPTSSSMAVLAVT